MAKDKAGRPIVVVTGYGVVTSLGAGKQDNWAKLTAGQSGIREITRFATDGLKTRIAGTVDFVSIGPAINAPELSQRFAEMAGEEAVAQSGIGSRGDFPGPLFLGVAPVEIEWQQRHEVAVAAGANDALSYNDLTRAGESGRFENYYERFLFGSVADGLAEKFGTKGAPISLSALSASNDPPTGASKPFSKNRDGFVMAEGAGALVLESLEHAQGRGAKILGVIEGLGEMADSFHRTRSAPDGKPTIGCITHAIADAGLSPDDIDYINPHGTGTPENDKNEYISIAAVFGERARSIPTSSNKSMIGHTLSAAGAVESVFSLMTLEHQRVPPTINYAVPDPAIPLDVVPNVARDARVTHVLSNSFGFGGQNVSLVIGREPR